MKPKQFVIGVIVALCAAAGIYALVKSRGAAAAPEEEGSTASVVNVQTGLLKRMTLHHYVTGYGTVEPAAATAHEPAADAPLAAPGPGVVAKVNVIEGQHVEKGDVLVELNSGTATAEYAELQAERQRQLYAQHNTSLKALQDVEAQLALLRIVAPLSGTVARLNVKPGAAVDVNMVVAEVMDLNRLVVSAGVPASEAGELKAGQEVQVQTKPPVTATLSFVSPAVDAGNGTVLTRALLPADSGLRPGQFVQLRIVTSVHTNCLAAPEESAVTDESGHSVVALIHGDQAAQTPVQTGFRENGWVEITGTDLKEGDSVATVGAYGLPEKTKIVVVNPSGGAASATNSYPSPAQ
jgi:membrane fusion protein (multidrug efflux system)